MQSRRLQKAASKSIKSGVLGVWHFRWSGPAFRDYPAVAKNEYDYYMLGVAQSSASGTGSISYASNNGQTDADHGDDIQALVNAGKKVMLGIGGGGAGAGGITVTNSAQAQQMVASIVSLQSTFHFNGIALTLRSDSSTWNAAGLTEVFQSLKNQFGPSFTIGIDVNYDNSAAATATVGFLSGLASSLYDYVSPVLYNIAEASSSQLSTYAVQKVGELVGANVPANKIILEFLVGASATTSPDVTTTSQAYLAVRSAYPNLRGASIWNDKDEDGRSWGWTTTMGALVHSSSPPAAQPTSTPRNLSATPAQTSVALTWQVPSIVNGTLSGYNVYNGSTKLTSTPITQTTYTVNSLTAGSVYTFSVEAVTSNDTSPRASVSTTALPVTSTGGFATLSGMTLLLDGQPWKPVGVNLPWVFGCDASRMMSNAEYTTMFQRAAPKSLYRLWAYGNYSISTLDNMINLGRPYVTALSCACQTVYMAVASRTITTMHFIAAVGKPTDGAITG